MSQIVSRFFVTRQTANILQDLAKRCEQAGSISVLYGVNGVGKSRLLAQFAQNLAGGEDCFHILLDQNGALYPAGRADYTQPVDDMVKSLLQRLPAGSILLIDQYERMPAPVNRDVLDFWLRSAHEKNLKLVVALESAHLAAFAQSLEDLPLVVESVELKALNEQERLEFLRVHCCPQTAQSVIVSASLKQSLKHSGGLFPALQKLLQQHQETIQCRENTPARSLLNRRWLAVALLLSLFVAVLLVVKNPLQQVLTAEVVGQQRPAAQAEPSHATPVKKEPIIVQTPTVEADLARQPVQSKQILPTGDVDVIEQAASADTAINPSTAEVVANAVQAERQTQPQDDLIGQRMRATRAWLEQATGRAASIQIMTLNATAASHQALLSYLARLENAGVDIDQIMIFPFLRGAREMTGVLYGRFENTLLARNQIKKLPPVLKADRPMIRTVVGLRQDQRPKQN